MDDLQRSKINLKQKLHTPEGKFLVRAQTYDIVMPNLETTFFQMVSLVWAPTKLRWVWRGIFKKFMITCHQTHTKSVNEFQIWSELNLITILYQSCLQTQILWLKICPQACYKDTYTYMQTIFFQNIFLSFWLFA